MKRRNMIVTIGSIAAGGATFVGTGAVSSMEAERNVTGRVVGDKSAYVAIREGADHGFAAENTDGEFRVGFDNDPDGGDGLNPDSVNTFDDVFRIRNTGPEKLNVRIEDSNERLGFYFGEEPNDGSFENASTGTVGLESAQEAVVGVWADLRDVGTGDVFDTQGEDFTVYAEDGSPDESNKN
jgi:hypothetical protein